jgi:C4-type Zn-finger protein
MEEIMLACPYCGETITALIDGSAGDQEYYEDCPVCCAPILFLLSIPYSGNIVVDIKRDDE